MFILPFIELCLPPFLFIHVFGITTRGLTTLFPLLDEPLQVDFVVQIAYTLIEPQATRTEMHTSPQAPSPMPAVNPQISASTIIRFKGQQVLGQRLIEQGRNLQLHGANPTWISFWNRVTSVLPAVLCCGGLQRPRGSHITTSDTLEPAPGLAP